MKAWVWNGKGNYKSIWIKKPHPQTNLGGKEYYTYRELTDRELRAIFILRFVGAEEVIGGVGQTGGMGVTEDPVQYFVVDEFE